jgi:hypothetical protein
MLTADTRGVFAREGLLMATEMTETYPVERPAKAKVVAATNY